MQGKRSLAAAALLIVASTVACSGSGVTEEVLYRQTVSSLDGVVMRSGVALDLDVTSDGNGSLRLAAQAPTTFLLYELTDLDVEDTRLFYRARVRTEEVRGKAYLEMWCHFPGRGEFFSRGLDSSLSGTNEWSTRETPFFLKAGDKPDRVNLNLVVEGTGRVWVDEIALIKAVR